MELTRIGKKITAKSGIKELMEDISLALKGDEPAYLLGGGNPAHIPEINTLWQQRVRELLDQPKAFEDMLTDYDSPHGSRMFLEALSGFFNREYGWNLTPENLAVTPGSQSAFFVLLNMFGGTLTDGRRKKILFPLCPEYTGYANQALEEDVYTSIRGDIRILDETFYKYHVDFNRLDLDGNIGAVCLSRPTNPTGNVITDSELDKLIQLTGEQNIPLLVDNAYGEPFPHILFEDVSLRWEPHMILGMSLSKVGLPSARVGIIVADRPVINALSASNAIISLTSGSIGQILTAPLFASGKIREISRNLICPFYREKSLTALSIIKEIFSDNIDFRIHKCEGSFFLWIWFRNLSITTEELYQRLKKRRVFVVPGECFFFGLDEPWDHRHECIRINFSLGETIVRRGIEILAEEVGMALK